MAKRKETKAIEQCLHDMCREKRWYGCEEVTVGFANSNYGGNGREIADFVCMDSKGCLRFYEIKVSLEDMKSDAKKSWYGKYNYLCVTEDLWKEKEKWIGLIPSHVGILAGEPWIDGKWSLESKRRCTAQTVDEKTDMLMKESLLRSLYWKMDKYRGMADQTSFDGLKKKLKETEKKMEEYKKYYFRVIGFENAWWGAFGRDIDIEKATEKLKEKARKRREKRKNHLPAKNV